MISALKGEIKKLMILRAGWVFILLFLIINIYHIDNNNTVLKNMFSANKEKKLNEYYETFGKEYSPSMVDAVEELYSKTLKSEDDEEVKFYSTVIKYYYKSYLIAKENDFTDRIIDARGYSVLLDEYGSINVWILLVSLILTALIFGVDKDKGQEDIVKSTTIGNRKVCVAKLVLATLLIVLLNAIRFICVYISVRKHFDISDLGVPIQNISSMQGVDIKLDVGGAIGFVVLMECLGLIMSNLVCAFLISAANKSAAGFFWGFALAYVPVFLLNTDKLYRKIPLSGAYLAPYNFVDEIEKFIGQYIMTIVLIIVLYVINYIIYSNAKIWRGWCRNGRT